MNIHVRRWVHYTAVLTVAMTLVGIAAYSRSHAEPDTYEQEAIRLESIFLPILGRDWLRFDENPRYDARVQQLLTAHIVAYEQRIVRRVDSFEPVLSERDQAYMLACMSSMSLPVHAAIGRYMLKADDSQLWQWLLWARANRLYLNLPWSRVRSAVLSQHRDTAVIAANFFEELCSLPMSWRHEGDLITSELPALFREVANPSIQGYLFAAVGESRNSDRRWVFEGIAVEILEDAEKKGGLDASMQHRIRILGPALAYLCSRYGIERDLPPRVQWDMIQQMRRIRLREVGDDSIR